METTQKDYHHLSVNQLIDLLLVKAAELLKAADEGRIEAVNGITRELADIHNLIKTKRASQ